MIARPKNGNGGPPKPGPIRCAIYCRKSVDKGNGGEFGSIEAQREAVESYIKSQREAGWVALSQHYDDLGLSGGSTARPSYQRLLADVEAGLVDVVAVYKFDRLSRSQRDFLNVLDFFEQHGVQFVSVTQHMDTSTPHGRFAMGMLIQVAQLEREVAAERVRDKTAASRRHGIWTGGAVPLGYRSVNKHLVIDAAGADAVRAIVAAYVETGSLTATLESLRERGIMAKNGAPFTVATLRTLLHSPLIGGRINAGDTVVKATHEAILDETTWQALQAKLTVPEKPVPRHRRVKSPALLANLVRCGKCGATWSAHYTSKKAGKRYGAYTCQTIIQRGASACPGSRAPAHALETFVIEKVRAVGRDPDVLSAAVAGAGSELDAQRKELTANVIRLKADAKRLHDDQTRLVGTVAQRGDAAPELVEHLNALRPAVEAADTALEQAKADLAALKRQTIDADELRQAIASFDGVWQHLFPKERQRILGLLIERIVVTAGDDGEDVAITYSAEGARTMLAEASQEAP